MKLKDLADKEYLARAAHHAVLSEVGEVLHPPATAVEAPKGVKLRLLAMICHLWSVNYKLIDECLLTNKALASARVEVPKGQLRLTARIIVPFQTIILKGSSV